MSTRRQLRAATPPVVEHEVPERLLTCYVEDWCDPGHEPVPSWRGDIRAGTKEWVWHWQLVARRRQRDARAAYMASTTSRTRGRCRGDRRGGVNRDRHNRDRLVCRYPAVEGRAARRKADPMLQILAPHDDGRMYPAELLDQYRGRDGSWRVVVTYSVEPGSRYRRAMPDCMSEVGLRVSTPVATS